MRTVALHREDGNVTYNVVARPAAQQALQSQEVPLPWQRIRAGYILLQMGQSHHHLGKETQIKRSPCDGDPIMELISQDILLVNPVLARREADLLQWPHQPIVEEVVNLGSNECANSVSKTTVTDIAGY
jgi:hypothetical protein